MITRLLLVISLLSGAAVCATPLPTRYIDSKDTVWQIIPIDKMYGDIDDCSGNVTKKNASLAGLVKPDQHLIFIVRGLDPAEEREVVIHELMHVEKGASFSCQMFNGHDAIYKLAPVVVQILRDEGMKRYLSQKDLTARKGPKQ